MASTRSLAGETHIVGAEGATTPETLRQKDRDGYELLESDMAVVMSAEGVTCES